jgi:hypothetical protein
MTMILHLGVLDIPYSDKQAATTLDKYNALKAGKGVMSKSAARSSVTTGEVATFLEDRYGVLEHFYEAHQQDIADLLASAMAGELETILQGGPRSSNLSLGAATSEIEGMFRKFLAEREIERLGIPGVPTEAALTGVNHRLAHPYAKANPRRPSFIDTGLYQTSQRTWVTE